MFNTKLWLAQLNLKASSPQKRLDAVRKIHALKDPAAVEALTAAFEDAEPAVRAEIVSALGDIESPAVITPLLGALRDTSETVQELAVQALRKTRDASVIEPLVGVLLRGTPGVQYYAAQALRELNWSPRTLGEQIPFYVAGGDFKRVTMFGSAAVGALSSVLRGGSHERRVAAANALGEMGDPSVLQPLIAALKDPEAMVRAAAANGLARVGDPQSSLPLAPLLRDSARNVRVAAVNALGQIGDRNALDPLLKLVNDREWEVRAALAETFGKLADKRALPAVLGLLNDRDQEVRQNAADALGKVGDDSVLENLVLAMVDEHIGVRQAASRAITLVDPYWDRSPLVEAMTGELREATKHRDTGVQTAAAALLRRLTKHGPRTAPRAGDSRKQTDAVLDILTRLTRDSDEDVRLAAVEALARTRMPAVIPVLQSALSDTSRWVKHAADEGLRAVAM
jgi:HEAT repeat protein